MTEPTIKKKRTRKKRGGEHFCLDLIPDPFIVLQQTGKILDTNESCTFLLGSDKKQLIGKNFKDFKEFMKLWEKADRAVLDKK